MKNYEKKFKEEFSKIFITEESMYNIKENVRKKYCKRKNRRKMVLGFSSILLVFITGFGLVYADELKTFINNFIISKHVDEKGNVYTSGKASIIKVMNYDAEIPEILEKGTGKIYNIEELEELLDFKILKSSYIKTDEIKQYYTKKVSNKIANASFTIDNFTRPTQKDDIKNKYDLTVSFTTKYNNDNMASFNTSPGVASTEYRIKNLDTKAFILLINATNPQDKVSYAMARFVYDNVNYFLKFRFLPKEQQDDAIQKVKNILNSFSY